MDPLQIWEMGQPHFHHGDPERVTGGSPKENLGAVIRSRGRKRQVLRALDRKPRLWSKLCHSFPAWP